MNIKRCAIGFALALSLISCGLYTNIPAQIKLSGADTLTASVTYNVDQDRVTADIKNPKLALEGEPGSIGATYTEIGIEYLPTSLALTPRTIVIAGSIRVPSSHQFDSANKIVVGKTTTELPIISAHVAQLGNPKAQGRVTSQISAKVTLKGTDDAGFPTSLEFYVPINFLTSAAS